MNSIACIFSLTCAILLNDLTIPGPIFAVDSMPRVFIIDAVALRSVKLRTQQNSGSLKPALAKLTREADRALISAPLSVMHKEFGAAERRSTRLRESCTVLVA